MRRCSAWRLRCGRMTSSHMTTNSRTRMGNSDNENSFWTGDPEVCQDTLPPC